MSLLFVLPVGHAQSSRLPDAPEPAFAAVLAAGASVAQPAAEDNEYSSSSASASSAGFIFPSAPLQTGQTTSPQTTSGQTSSGNTVPVPAQGEGAPPQHVYTLPLDANGKPIPLERQEPHRILGFMPNFRTVAAGAAVHPPGWKYNFSVADHQAFDYSSFIFLGITSLTAEGFNSHPSLGKGPEGFFNYTWRGFVDKTDGTYLSAWLLPSLLHEDTRYYPLGSGHSIFVRSLYVISQQAVSRTYSGHDTPNIAGLGGKALTQFISRYYYPPDAGSFSVLATKFGYSVMRDVGFSAIREFYPDAAAHFIRKHREKVARLAAQNAAANGH